ncbi:MAG: glycosyltransferase family 2 protein [Anaerolineaceae bacterium]
MTNAAQTPELTICIVGINVEKYLRDCISSIHASGLTIPYEIIYVDNQSTDGTKSMLEREFPEVKTIWNAQNLGFAKANNQAILLSQSQYILLLNPDTSVSQNSIGGLIGFLSNHARTGIIGPKILNSDGSFQPHCKRGEARPWEVFCYFLGLSKLFPTSRLFSGYLQGFLDEDETNNVPAISGACMLIRKEVIEQIGPLDEHFFAYQEDTDFCVRARNAGWEVTYLPTSIITHFGGKGGANVQPLKSIFEWHHSYFLYYRKHLAKDYFFLLNWIVYLLMLVKFILSLIINVFRKEKHAGPKRG